MNRPVNKTFLFSIAWLIAAGLLVLNTVPAPAQSPAASSVPVGQRVFYASHSLMWDMPPVLTEVAQAYGIKDHTIVGHQRIGVSRTMQHWNMADNQNEAKKALRTGKVDVFVTSNLVHPDEGIDNFVKLGLEFNPNMRFLMQISWPGLGYTDNEQFNSGGGMGMPGGGMGMPGGGFGGFGGTGGPGAKTPSGGAQPPSFGGPGGGPMQAVAGAAAGGGGFGPFGGGMGMPGGGMGGMGGGGMFLSGNDEKTPEELAKINETDIKNAEAQAKRLNQELGKGKNFVFLVPTAQGHNALRTLIYKKEMPGMAKQSEVFIDSIGHPTAPVIALNAYLHFAVLYQRSPIGLPMPSILKNASKPDWNNEKLNLKLQELAWDLVTHYPPSGVAQATAPSIQSPAAKQGPQAKSSFTMQIKPDPRVEQCTYHFKEAGKDISYVLYVSSKVSKEKKNPLIVALHGLGGDGNFLVRDKLVDLAEEGGYIVVGPLGYNVSGWYGSPIVSFSRGPVEPPNLSELSEKDVMNVLALMREKYKIDEKRTYLMGHSMGGAGTLFLGSKYTSEWAAVAGIAPAAFLMLNNRKEYLSKLRDAKIPVIIVQGDKDTAVPVATTRQWIETMKELALDYKYIETAGGDHGTVITTGMPDIFAFFKEHPKR
jgi:poly(3-hydroxybutyrate) depolymerase